MKGFPPWPGIISVPPPDIFQNIDIHGKKCVFFFGTEDYAMIKTGSIRPYFKHEHVYKKNPKTTDLKKAIYDVEKFILENLSKYAQKFIARSPYVLLDKEIVATFSKWNNLPSTVLHLIFKKLPQKERIKASSSCKNWRQALFHPAFWINIRIPITTKNDIFSVQDRILYFNINIIPLASHVTIPLEICSVSCFKLAILVVQSLKNNGLLKSLIIEPVYSSTSLESNGELKCISKSLESNIIKLITVTKSLEGFSYKGIVFNTWKELILKLSKNNKDVIRCLELASCGERYDLSETIPFDPLDSFLMLTNLQVFSLDFNFVTSQLFPAMSVMKKLKLLVLHVLEDPVSELHDNYWLELKNSCPEVEVKLTIISCPDVVQYLHTKILRPSIPLVQLKVLFCSMLNTQAISFIQQHYRNTLRSLTWVDSHGTTNPACLMEGPFEPVENIDDINVEIDEDMNPLLPLSAHCTKLSELTIIGYFMDPLDVCVIARLRGSNLKRFDIMESDMCLNRPWNKIKLFKIKKVVSQKLNQDWSPLKSNDLPECPRSYILKSTLNDGSNSIEFWQ
ncbi:uncharacterized protein LOC126905780 isoform X2 [Daktulosphaira vitifoliae]|nr:uncharacterized protein LOC126905780 isoform X2 [Daktulosphaira vitifoliae]